MFKSILTNKTLINSMLPNIAINHRAFHALDFKPQAVFAGYCGRYILMGATLK